MVACSAKHEETREIKKVLPRWREDEDGDKVQGRGSTRGSTSTSSPHGRYPRRIARRNKDRREGSTRRYRFPSHAPRKSVKAASNWRRTDVEVNSRRVASVPIRERNCIASGENQTPRGCPVDRNRKRLAITKRNTSTPVQRRRSRGHARGQRARPRPLPKLEILISDTDPRRTRRKRNETLLGSRCWVVRVSRIQRPNGPRIPARNRE